MKKVHKTIIFNSKKIENIITKINEVLGNKKPVLGIANQYEKKYLLFFGKAFVITPDKKTIVLKVSSTHRKHEFFEGGPGERDASGITTYFCDIKLVIDLIKKRAEYTVKKDEFYQGV